MSAAAPVKLIITDFQHSGAAAVSSPRFALAPTLHSGLAVAQRHLYGQPCRCRATQHSVLVCYDTLTSDPPAPPHLVYVFYCPDTVLYKQPNDASGRRASDLARPPLLRGGRPNTSAVSPCRNHSGWPPSDIMETLPMSSASGGLQE